ncbi:hypothetical protein EK21DRAFT_95280 [Setomelanomma holmii]|uniref:Uncharacterized protein n=1 Tax=Setomelanomma holmii TaxID=210430 RepID=A0A9P4GU61_9PLEO|nr:hypothetical protein EK21DRAFT_95280 [Setomelanomma holmii]
MAVGRWWELSAGVGVSVSLQRAPGSATSSGVCRRREVFRRAAADFTGCVKSSGRRCRAVAAAVACQQANFLRRGALFLSASLDVTAKTARAGREPIASPPNRAPALRSIPPPSHSKRHHPHRRQSVSTDNTTDSEE